MYIFAFITDLQIKTQNNCFQILQVFLSLPVTNDVACMWRVGVAFSGMGQARIENNLYLYLWVW